MKSIAVALILLVALPVLGQRSDPQLAPPKGGSKTGDRAKDAGRAKSGGAAAAKSIPAATPAPVDLSIVPAKVEDNRTILEGIMEDYRYDPQGKRDPFLEYNPPTLENDCGPFENCEAEALQRFDLDQLKLVGIIWDVKTPKAMFVDPGKKTHMVSEQDKIGRNNGYIAEIREEELVVIEKYYNLGRFTYQTRILKLQKD